MKLDSFKIKDFVYYHKQVEHRDGMVFMRMKKRPMCFIKYD